MSLFTPFSAGLSQAHGVTATQLNNDSQILPCVEQLGVSSVGKPPYSDTAKQALQVRHEGHPSINILASKSKEGAAVNSTLKVATSPRLEGGGHVSKDAVVNHKRPKEILHLPPEAAPFVLVLEGVPKLEEWQNEDHGQLKDKISHWASNNIVGGSRFCYNIIMVRVYTI